MHYTETAYGFEYGSANVARLFSNEKAGWVMVGITTPKDDIQVYITKTGKIRVHSKTGEWIPVPKGGKKA